MWIKPKLQFVEQVQIFRAKAVTLSWALNPVYMYCQWRHVRHAMAVVWSNFCTSTNNGKQQSFDKSSKQACSTTIQADHITTFKTSFLNDILFSFFILKRIFSILSNPWISIFIPFWQFFLMIIHNNISSINTERD